MARRAWAGRSVGRSTSSAGRSARPGRGRGPSPGAQRRRPRRSTSSSAPGEAGSSETNATPTLAPTVTSRRSRQGVGGLAGEADRSGERPTIVSATRVTSQAWQGTAAGRRTRRRRAGRPSRPTRPRPAADGRPRRAPSPLQRAHAPVDVLEAVEGDVQDCRTTASVAGVPVRATSASPAQVPRDPAGRSAGRVGGAAARTRDAVRPARRSRWRRVHNRLSAGQVRT